MSYPGDLSKAAKWWTAKYSETYTSFQSFNNVHDNECNSTMSEFLEGFKFKNKVSIVCIFYIIKKRN